MKKRKLWIIGVGLVALGGWLARPGGAAQQPVALKTIEVTLPVSYGELRGVDRGALYFQSVDGTIHVVHLNLSGEVDQDTIRIKRQ